MPTPSKSPRARRAELTDKRIDAMVERLAQNRPIRRALPRNGRVHIDRQLPFLCVYRRPQGIDDDATGRLLFAEAAYALVPGDRAFREPVTALLGRIAEVMVDRFGAFLFLEIWSSDDDRGSAPPGRPPRPAFDVHALPADEFSITVQTLKERLGAIKALKQSADVGVTIASRVAPPGMRPLFTPKELDGLGGYLVGIDVDPVFINPHTEEPYPLLFRSIKRQLGRALDRAFYEFAVEHTTHQPEHYYALGRRAMVKAVWETDRRLAAVSNSFDLLYQVTPVNAEAAWRAFKRKHFQKTPVFLYRPRVIDPGRMKRMLYDIPIERVEDPTLMHLFMDKQMELDRQLTMLHDLGTARFLYESLQLHGPVSRTLAAAAEEMLERIPARSRSESRGGTLSAADFAKLARREVARYARVNAGFDAKVRVTSDIYTGLMVSRGSLLVGTGFRVPKSRAAALLQHEVGTHLLTYFNGQAQPFKMLSSGLPGYDELQEGLAVLSEYLVGGLSAARLRVLAARVLAARALVDGASFVDVFRLLDRTYEFSQQAAYTVTMRVFRGGGLVKDAVYLRGLVGILKYLSSGGDFDTLFIGKIAASHVPVIEELLLRKILKPPPALPRHSDPEAVRARMQRLRRGVSVPDLLKPTKEEA